MAEQDVVVPVLRDDRPCALLTGNRHNHRLNLVYIFTDVQSSLRIQAYLKMEASDEGRSAVRPASAGGVAEVRYVSKEEAFLESRKSFRTSRVLEGIENPLPVSDSLLSR